MPSSYWAAELLSARNDRRLLEVASEFDLQRKMDLRHLPWHSRSCRRMKGKRIIYYEYVCFQAEQTEEHL